jgi:hypothetical protein
LEPSQISFRFFFSLFGKLVLLCFPAGYDRDKAQDDDQGNAGYLYEKQHPKRTPEILHRYAVRKQLGTG